MINQNNAKIFKAFCDENRLTILQMLCTGEKCACALQEALSVGQSTLSHHMKILCESGIVNIRREGKWAYYCINQAGRDAALQLIDQYTQITADAQAQTCTDD